MRQRSLAASFRRALVPVMTGFLSVSILLTGCKSTNTTASTTRTGTGSHPGGTPAAPYTPVPANPSQMGGDLPAPSPVGYNTLSPASNAEKPVINGKAAILVDRYGRVLFEKNADQRVPVASTQKLLLGILIAESGNLSKPITVADSDTWAEPTKMGIKAGQVYTKGELLKAVLVRSSNDISRTLARDHSGSVSAFAANMNARARQLGMHNSYFTNASGLPKPAGQYSTARDLAKLGMAAQRYAVIRDAVRTPVMTFTYSTGTTKTIYNTNKVLGHHPYCLGGKTGYTNAAGKCLVFFGTKGGKSVTGVILGSKTPTIWQDTEKLLNYGLGL